MKTLKKSCSTEGNQLKDLSKKHEVSGCILIVFIFILTRGSWEKNRHNLSLNPDLFRLDTYRYRTVNGRKQKISQKVGFSSDKYFSFGLFSIIRISASILVQKPWMERKNHILKYYRLISKYLANIYFLWKTSHS